MNKKYLFFLFLLSGCTCGVVNEMDVLHVKEQRVEAVAIGDFLSDVRYVPIDLSGSEALMDEPQKVLCHGNDIFLSDGKGIFRMSCDGRHVSLLSKYGRGPGEYLGILDFTVDEDCIYVLDNDRKLLKYTKSGEHMSSSVLDFFPASLCAIGNGRLMITSAYQSAGDKFHVYDSEGLSRISSFQEVNECELSWRHIRGQSNFYVYGQSVIFHEPMNDVIYKFEDMSAVPVRELDLYGRNAPGSFWQQRYSSVYDINMDAIRGRYCFGTPIYAESPGNIVFTYRDADKYLLCLYPKDSGNARQSERLSFPGLNSSFDIASLLFGFYGEENQIVVIPGYDLPGDIKVNVLHVPEYYDNPVLCIGNMI